MAEWSREQVEERLAEAADVLKRLPEERVPGYFSTWPEVFRDWGDLVGQTPQAMSMPPPSPQAISRMEATLNWLRWLEPDDARLVWARGEGCPWKAICWRFGISRATAHRRWEYGLSIITWKLNGQSVPAKRSRAFLVDRVRSSSSF